jgi:hypothetical protein
MTIAMIDISDRYDKLIQALETGWEVEEPVLSGYIGRWRDPFYHFFLRKPNEKRTRLVSVPDSESLQHFLASRKFVVTQV